MGTNYYVTPNACPHCGRGDERIHIGKSSAGWVFALNTHPELGINTIADWLAYLPGKEIRDEYGRKVELGKLVETIANRAHPQDLRRAPEDGGRTRHGEGTWDYHSGEFS